MRDSTLNIDGLSAINLRLAQARINPPAPGTLTKWGDADGNQYWEFTGNDTTTGTDVMARILQKEVILQKEEHEVPGLKEVESDPKAAADLAYDLAARLFVNPDAPIPSGETQEYSLKKLVQMITPFLEAYAKAHVQGTERDASNYGLGEYNKTTGAVFSQGLTLPIND